MSPLTEKLLNLKVAVGSGTTTAVSGVRSGYRRMCTGSTAAYKAVAMDGQVRSSEGTDLLPWIFPTAEKRRQLRLLVMLVFARLIVLAFTNYYAGLCSANLTRALESKDPDRFLYSARWVLFFWPINVVLGYCSRYTNSRLVATIQLANMQTLSKALYSNREAVARPFYRLQFVEGGKTPEFQLIQDSMEYGGVFVNILVTMANTAVAPMYLAEAVQMHSQRFYVFFALLIVSTLIQAVVFTRIIGHIDWLIWEKVNNVRSVLTRVLSNVEAIALFRGGDAEMLRVRRVHSMVWNCRMDWARRYSIVIAWGIFQSSGFMLFPVFSVIRELLSGRSNVSDIQRFLAVLAGGGAPLLALFSLGPQFTQITVNKGRILHILRETERIHDEAARLKRITEKGQQSKEFIVTHENDGQDRSAVFELRDVTIRTPPLQHSVGNLLIEGLSLRMGVGDSLLIVGDSGVGKSALLFAISGVWASGRGEIQRCRRSGVLCLPQRPFTFLGSLRQQLLYPDLDDTQTSNDELWGVLSTLNLERHLRQHGLDKIASWADVLSPGQQQRISVARALLAAGRVRLLLLDEATAALDLHNERIVYEALLQCRPHSLVSVGHRPSLRKYHQRVLTLTATETEDGGTCTTHTVSTLPPAPPSAKAGQAAAESHLAEAQQADAASPATLSSHEEIPTGEVQRQPKNWLPEPYNTVVACFYEIWRPLKEANPMVMKDSKKNVLYGLGASAVGSTAAIYSYQLTFKMIAALTERLEEETYSHLWKLLLLGLVPIFSSPLIFYNYATIFSGNAERLRLFLLERFLGGPDAAYYSMRLQGGLHDDNPADILTGADCDLVILTWLFLASFSGSIVAICVSVVRLLFWSPMMTLGLLVPVVIAVPMSIRSMQYAMLHNLNATGLRASICVRVAHARENAEAVALLDGGPAEQRQLDRMAAKFITAGQSVEFVNLDLGTYIGILSTLFDHLNTCFVGFKVISGEVKIIEYYDTAMMIGIAFRIINTVKILCGERVIPNFVSCRRVRELMARINSAKDHVGSGGIQLTEHPEEKVVLELRCIQLALMQNARTKQLQQQLLLTRVSARLWEGESLLIVGESGLGKSSLLRAMAGICTAGSGQIYCPQKDHVMFFAQRPYLCFGTLREQLLYPHVERRVEDKPLKAALKAVDLEHLLETPGLGSAAETPEETEAALKESQRWTSQLSLGEIQRLGFARLLLREGVRLTLFDEGTSALDLTHEATLYSLLTGNTRSYVSVAHRPQLYQWHSHVLVLEQNSQGKALGVSRFSDMAHYRQELEGLGAHRSEKTGLRLQPADGHTANGANGAGGKSENGASHANGVHVRP